jgi:drug/metabolite transporter (DMT)-like permease
MKHQGFDKEKCIGTVYVLLSAICFSLGGVLIKSILWSSVTIQGIRSLFAFLVVGIYMVLTHHRFVWNKTVVAGAAINTVMSFSFVEATKLTTAANAIVLQFTEPVFVILFMWLLYKKKPGKDAVITCGVVFAGIVIFFLESLSSGGMAGNFLAVFSGATYALVMMLKGFEGADFESSLLVSYVMSMVLSVPGIWQEAGNSSLQTWVLVILLGVFQFGFSYIFLSKGLDRVSPVTASLTSTIEPVLNPILVAVFCGEKVGCLSVFGAVLVIGAATVYNIRQAAVPKKKQA